MAHPYDGTGQGKDVLATEPTTTTARERSDLPAWRTAAPCTGSVAWQAFVRSHALVTRQIEADLLAAHQLSLVSFDVLERLADAPEQRLRMAELADLLVVSRSGVTRAVDRLVRQGLVVREPCDSDLRGTYATLTDRGMERLRAAAPTHQAGVQFYLLDPLGPAGAGLAAVLEPVLARLRTT